MSDLSEKISSFFPDSDKTSNKFLSSKESTWYRIHL